MELLRVMQTAQVTMSHTFVVDETATDAAGGVTVTIKRLDGTLVNTGPATHPGTPGVYTYVLPAQSQLDTLSVDWSGSIGGAVVTARDYVEIVGGYLFSLADARSRKPALDPAQYPTATLARKRVQVEMECERICGVAFVPRFTRIALSGNGTSAINLPHAYLRTVRAVTVNGTAWAPADVAQLGASPAGVLVRSPAASWSGATWGGVSWGVPGGAWGGAVWPWGVANIIVEYEHGWDMPPPDLSDAAITRLRNRLGVGATQVPANAISYTTQDGSVYRLTPPSKTKTGMPEVDGTYEGYTIDMGGFA